VEENPQNYRKALDELEHEIEDAEENFEKVKDESADGELQEKQKRAEELMDEIHSQIEFLEEQLDRIGEKD
jgi:septation ring formation regulator EzrA